MEDYIERIFIFKHRDEQTWPSLVLVRFGEPSRKSPNIALNPIKVHGKGKKLFFLAFRKIDRIAFLEKWAWVASILKYLSSEKMFHMV